MSLNPHELPVYSRRQRILESLNKHQVIVVESPTGSGKTTQIPIILHEAGYADNGIIGITQPRRIAAVSVCRYIARQLQSEVGSLVSYKMRFEDTTGPETRLKIVTDGTLLQEMKGDRWLSSYSVIMIDEAHERTLNIDFILGLIQEILPHRPDLKIIISSATLNPIVFSQYFNSCPIVTIESPIYPVKLFYDPPSVYNNTEALISKITSVVEKIVRGKRETQEKIHERSRGRTSLLVGDQDVPGGDILIFCTGERMIKDCVTHLLSCTVRRDLQVMPLYGRLGSEVQEKVFDPTKEGKVKVVVATNVAETSITIDGISSVIDTGLAKLNYYNPQTYTSSLLETPISQASANQRKGRAGRTRPGQCYRLYPKEGFSKRPAYTREEIYRTDLAEVVLRMADIGIRDFGSFSFISPPDPQGILGAVDTLKLLDAIDDDNNLTEIGKRMALYPLMPRHARMIVESTLRYPQILREVIIISAFLSTNTPYLLPQGEEMEARKAHHAFRSDYHGDFASYLNLYWDFVEAKNRDKFAERYYVDKKILDEILAIVDQLEEITSRRGIPISEGGSSEDFIKACARGLIPFICVKDGRFNYRSVGVDKITIHPGSVLFRENPEFIVAGEIINTSRTYARSVSPLEKEWLAEIHPSLPSMLLIHPRVNKKNQSRGYQSFSKPVKDTTAQIWIAGEPFPLSRTPGKGNKKRAVLEWKRLHNALKRSKDATRPNFGGMRGTLLFDRNEVLPDSKVNTIIKAAETLNPKTDIRVSFPRGNYHIHKLEQRNDLISELTNLMMVTRGGKKTKKGGMGFIALYSDGIGCYWFRAIRSFHGAVSSSLESLEVLVDDVGDELKEEQTKMLSEIYRRLEALL